MHSQNQFEELVKPKKFKDLLKCVKSISKSQYCCADQKLIEHCSKKYVKYLESLTEEEILKIKHLASSPVIIFQLQDKETIKL